MKLSVIMCSFNTEKYVKRAINSILNQTFKDIELIIVDDCSTDNTKNIIKNYNDSRIILIENKKNMGAAYSRNIALQKASGTYIGFIDSDDYVDDNYYEELIKSIKDTDISVCDIKVIYENKNNEYNISSCYDKETDSFINVGLAASSCNKLFRSEILKGLTYPEGLTTEDIAFVIPALCKAKISYNKNVYYNYIQRDKSIQNSSFSEKKFDVFNVVELCFNRINNLNDDIKEMIIFNQIISMLFYSLTNEKSVIKRIKYLGKYHKLSKKYNLRSNKYYLKFIGKQGIYHRIYYKAMLSLNSMNLNILCSLLISLYHFYQKHLVKNVIDKSIDLDSIIELAKRNNEMKSDITISVVIPNYNYSKFLYQRLYSILSQKIRINEVIILDDCSIDNSRDMINNLVASLSNIINIKTSFNKSNSGSAFKQWQKGFELATSDYVWIAEADDYCSDKFLSNVVKPIKKDKNIVISYCDTAFIDSLGKVIHKSVQNEIDVLNSKHWNKSYINAGIKEVEDYTYLNCTISNVSSVLFKRNDYSSYFKQSGEFKQVGDWLFYLNVMLEGKVSYTNKVLNYYRIHGSNVTSITKKQHHFNEIVKLHKIIDKKIKLTSKQKELIKKRYEFLKKTWDIEEVPND